MSNEVKYHDFLDKISDPNVRFTVELFVSPILDKDSKKDFSTLKLPWLNSFNIQNISINSILTSGDRTKLQKMSDLPNLLHFERIPNQAYIEFFDFIEREIKNEPYYPDFISYFFCHIFRPLQCIQYHLSNSMANFTQGQDSDTIPYVYYKNISFFIRIYSVVPQQYQSVYSQILISIQNQILPNVSNSNSEQFLHDTFEITAEFTNHICASYVPSEYNDYSLIFITHVCQSISNNHLLLDFLPIYVKKISTLINHPSQSCSLLSRISFPSFLFQKTSKIELNESYAMFFVNICKEILQFFPSFAEGEMSDHGEIISSIFDYIQWFIRYSNYSKKLQKSISLDEFGPIQTNVLSDKPVFHLAPEYKQVFTKGYYNIFDFSFTNQLLFDSNPTLPEKESDLDEIVVPYISDFVNEFFSYDTITLISSFISKQSTLLSSFIQQGLSILFSNWTPELYLFYVSVLLQLETNLVIENLKSSLILWNIFINSNTFSKSVIKSKSPSLKRQLYLITISFVKKIFEIPSPHQQQILIIFTKWIDVNSLEHVFSVCNIFRMLYILSPQRFSNYISLTHFLDLIFQYDLIYKKYLLENLGKLTYEHLDNEKDSKSQLNSLKLIKKIKKARRSIFQTLSVLMSNQQIIDFISSEEIQISYFFSLLYELPMKSISYSFLSLFLSPYQKINTKLFTQIVKKLFETAEEKLNENIIFYIIDIIKLFSNGFNNQNSLADNFINEGFIEILPSIALRAKEINAANFYNLLITMVLCFFALSQCGNRFIRELDLQKWHFADRFSLSFQSDDIIDERLANFLISFVKNQISSLEIPQRGTINNPAALKLLYKIIPNNDIGAKIFACLLSLIMNNIENSWLCYHCGFLQKIISDINNGKYDPILTQIISAIGAYFLRISELNSLISAFKKSPNDFQQIFFEAIIKLLVQSDETKSIKETGFQIENEITQYLKPAFSNMSHFRLSFYASLSSQSDSSSKTNLSSDEKFKLIKIYTHEDQFIIYISKTNFYIDLKMKPDITFSVKYPEKINTEIVHFYEIVFTNSEHFSMVSLGVDKNKYEINLPKHFYFRSDPIKIEEYWEFKNQVTISLDQLKVTENNSFLFEESVPFPTPFTNILDYAGGAEIFLPFFESASSSSYLLNLLRVIRHIILRSINLNTDFFRAYTYCLSKVNSELWNYNSCSELAFLVYHISPLENQVSFLKFIILNISIWKKLSPELTDIIILQTIDHIYQTKQNSFPIDFDYCLIKLWILQESQPSLSDKIIHLLSKLASTLLTPSSVQMLINIAFEGNSSPFFRISSLRILHQAIQKNRQIVLNCLPKDYPYMPFLQGIIDSEGLIRFWSLQLFHSILYLNTASGKLDFSSKNIQKHVIKASSSMPPQVPDPDFISNILSFLVGEKESIHEIYIPILCNSLQKPFPSNESKKQFTDSFFKLVKSQYASRQSLKNLSGWKFWILYLGLVSENFLSACDILGMMGYEDFLKPPALTSTITSDFGLIISFSSILKQPATPNLAKYLINFLSQDYLSNPSTQETLLKFIFLLFSFSIFPGSQYFRTPSNPQSTQYDNKSKFIIPPISLVFLGFFCQKHLITDISISFELINLSTYSHSEFLLAKKIFEFIQPLKSSKKELLQEYSYSFGLTINLAAIYTVLYLVLASELPEKVADELQEFSNVLFHYRDPSFQDVIEYTSNLSKALYSSSTFRKAKSEHLLPSSMNIQMPKSPSKEDRTHLRSNSRPNWDYFHNLLLKNQFLKKLQASIQDVIHFYELCIIKAKTDEKPSFVMETEDIFDYNINSTRSIFQIENELEDQQQRQSARSWRHCWRKMQENNSLWQDDKEDKHWKVEMSLDSHFRRFRMKRNRLFDDHLSAVRQKNLGFSEPIKPRIISPYELKASPEREEGLVSFEGAAQIITVTMIYKGTLRIFDQSIIFESSEARESVENTSYPKIKLTEFNLQDIKYIFKRRYIHKDIGCEIFTQSLFSYFFVFSDSIEENEKNPKKLSPRDEFLHIIQKRLTNKEKQSKVYIQTENPSKVLKDLKIVEKWQKGMLTNYGYLIWLNIIGGRSFNDLSQYPIFPWIIADYESPTLNLDDPKTFRDLSKNILSLNEEKLEFLETKFDLMVETPIRCHSRIFYSSPALTINMLIRQEPYTSMHIKLQKGQFDHPGRLFNNLSKLWNDVLHDETEFRELIPEFFTFPQMFQNDNHFDFGISPNTQTRVDDVILPIWAKNAEDFVAKNLAALESDYVSANINRWVDFIFGYLQRGEKAVQAKNDFMPMSYPDAFEKYEKTFGKQAIIDHALNFGVIPNQLFSEPSPQKKVPIFGDIIKSGPILMGIFNGRKPTSVSIKGKHVYISLENGSSVIVDSKEIKMEKRIYLKQVCSSEILVLSSLSHNFISILKLQHEKEKENDDSFIKGKVLYESQRKSELIKVLSAYTLDNRLCLCSSSGDSSLFITMINLDSIPPKSRLTTSSIHSREIISISCSLAVDIVASIDSQTLILTSISSGRFVSSSFLGSNDDNKPIKVQTTDMGHIIVFYTNKFEVYDLRCIKIAEEFNDCQVDTFTIHTTFTGEEYLIVAYSDGNLKIKRVITLETLKEIHVDGKIISLDVSSFGQKLTYLIYILNDGTVFMKNIQ